MVDRLQQSLEKAVARNRRIAGGDMEAELERAVARNRGGLVKRGLRATGEFIGETAEGIKEAVVGETDPEFKNLEGFTGEGIGDLKVRSEIERAKLVATSDPAFGRAVRRALGARVVGKPAFDSFGREIITYKDDEDILRTEFVNAPGLDLQDVDRTISGAVPFVAAATGVGRAVAGAGLGVGALSQAGGQAATSVIQDAIAGEEVDPGKAGAAAIGGAAGEFLAPAFTALRSAFRQARGAAPQGALVDPSGNLTPRGQAVIRESGIPDEEITPELLAALQAPDVPTSASPAEALFRSEADTIGVRTSAGTRAKAGEDVKLEKEAREGVLGRGSQEQALAFDRGQRGDASLAIRETTRRLADDPEAPLPSRPARTDETGEVFQGGVESAAARGEKAISDAFADVDIPAVFPGGIPLKMFESLEDDLIVGLRTTAHGPQTPNANEAIDLLQRFAQGRATAPAVNLTGRELPERLQTFDEVRRIVNEHVKGARKNSPSDGKAALAVKKAYNSWLERLAKESLDTASPEDFVKLQAALQLTAKVKQVFGTKGIKADDAAGRIIRDILDKADSPEGALNMILPKGFLTAAVPGAIGALKRLKPVLLREQPDAWHALRQAYWLKVTRGNKAIFRKGEISRRDLDTHFGQIARNIDDVLENQMTLMKVLYTKDDLSRMRQMSRGLKRAQAEDPNPSGTATMGAHIQRNPKDNVLVNMIKRQAASAQLGRQSLRATGFRVLAKKVKSVLGERGDAIAAGLMRRQFSGRLPKNRIRAKAPAGLGGAAAAEIAEEENELPGVPF